MTKGPGFVYGFYDCSAPRNLWGPLVDAAKALGLMGPYEVEARPPVSAGSVPTMDGLPRFLEELESRLEGWPHIEVTGELEGSRVTLKSKRYKQTYLFYLRLVDEKWAQPQPDSVLRRANTWIEMLRRMLAPTGGGGFDEARTPSSSRCGPLGFVIEAEPAASSS